MEPFVLLLGLSNSLESSYEVVKKSPYRNPFSPGGLSNDPPSGLSNNPTGDPSNGLPDNPSNGLPDDPSFGLPGDLGLESSVLAINSWSSILKFHGPL